MRIRSRRFPVGKAVFALPNKSGKVNKRHNEDHKKHKHMESFVPFGLRFVPFVYLPRGELKWVAFKYRHASTFYEEISAACFALRGFTRLEPDCRYGSSQRQSSHG